MKQYVGLLELICSASPIPTAEVLQDVSVLYARLGEDNQIAILLFHRLLFSLLSVSDQSRVCNPIGEARASILYTSVKIRITFKTNSKCGLDLIYKNCISCGFLKLSRHSTKKIQISIWSQEGQTFLTFQSHTFPYSSCPICLELFISLCSTTVIFPL